MTSIGYRAGVTGRISGGTTGSPISLTVPATVQEGDVMLLGYTVCSATGDAGGQATVNAPTGVTGWTQVAAQQSLGSAVAKVFWKVAGPSDAGATVTINHGTSTAAPRAAASLVAYQGGDTTTPLAVISTALASATSATSHVMPTIDTSGKGDTWIVSFFLDREATESASFSASSGWTLRQANLDTAGTTGGRAGTCVIDSGADVAQGTGQGGGTITGTQAGGFNFGWTVAIGPLVSTQTARPSTDVTTTGWTPSTTLGGGVQQASLLADSDDTTYVASAAGPSAQAGEWKLQAMSDAPNAVSARVQFAGGAASGTVKMELRQGSSTSIASRTDTWSSSPPTTPTDLVLTLTDDEQGDINDLTDLRIRVTVTAA